MFIDVHTTMPLFIIIYLYSVMINNNGLSNVRGMVASVVLQFQLVSGRVEESEKVKFISYYLLLHPIFIVVETQYNKKHKNSLAKA